MYLADTEATMWAEWYRHLAEAAIPPHAALPRVVYDVTISRPLLIGDLRTAEAVAAVGAVLDPTRRSWPACQQAGARLADAGWDGLLAPSAARPIGLALVMFWRVGAPAPCRARGDGRVHVTAPAPPTGLRT